MTGYFADPNGMAQVMGDGTVFALNQHFPRDAICDLGFAPQNQAGNSYSSYPSAWSGNCHATTGDRQRLDCNKCGTKQVIHKLVLNGNGSYEWLCMRDNCEELARERRHAEQQRSTTRTNTRSTSSTRAGRRSSRDTPRDTPRRSWPASSTFTNFARSNRSTDDLREELGQKRAMDVEARRMEMEAHRQEMALRQQEIEFRQQQQEMLLEQQRHEMTLRQQKAEFQQRQQEMEQRRQLMALLQQEMDIEMKVEARRRAMARYVEPSGYTSSPDGANDAHFGFFHSESNPPASHVLNSTTFTPSASSVPNAPRPATRTFSMRPDAVPFTLDHTHSASTATGTNTLTRTPTATTATNVPTTVNMPRRCIRPRTRVSAVTSTDDQRTASASEIEEALRN